MSNTDIDLIFAHLLHSGQMAKVECDINGQKVSLVKLGFEEPVIEEKEKAKFILGQSIQKMSDSMDQTQLKIGKLNEDIKGLIKIGSKKSALTLLAQKKKLESFWETLSAQRYHLEEQQIQLDEIDTHNTIMDVLDLAVKTGSSLKRDLEKYEDLFERIDEQRSTQEELATYIKQQSSYSMGDESQLLQELEDLEVEAVEGQLNNSQLRERVERQKLNESIEIRELERQLEELSVASTKVGGD